VGAHFLRRHRPADDYKPVQRGDHGEARLWRLGTALAVSFTLAVVGLAGLAWLAWVLLGAAGYRRHGAPELKDTIGVLQLVFATVAGAGALVALIVAYRRQKITEADSAHDRSRVFNERFTAIAAQLGDAQPAVRLAGVHAMAGLADDWEQNRQTCVDVLCAYLRLPYDPDPGEQASAAERLAFRASREVRHTVVRVITAHLTEGAAVSWQGLKFDFTGVVFDGGSFGGARFSGGFVDFRGAEFSSGMVDFGAEFSGGLVDFGGARFSGGMVSFRGARFSGGSVDFGGAGFSGGTVDFGSAEFSGGTVYLGKAEFSGGTVDFRLARWFGGTVDFSGAVFSRGMVDFRLARLFRGTVSFSGTRFSGGTVSFGAAVFSGGNVGFREAEFSGGTVYLSNAGFSGSLIDFGGAEFSGGTVSFGSARFSGGTVDFARAGFSGGAIDFEDAEFSGGFVDFASAGNWAHPPTFSWDGKPPAGVTLPAQASEERS
jgi:uncharacterized protein YjbI with pentapeptide repeats